MQTAGIVINEVQKSRKKRLFSTGSHYTKHPGLCRVFVLLPLLFKHKCRNQLLNIQHSAGRYINFCEYIVYIPPIKRAIIKRICDLFDHVYKLLYNQNITT